MVEKILIKVTYENGHEVVYPLYDVTEHDMKLITETICNVYTGQDGYLQLPDTRNERVVFINMARTLNIEVDLTASYFKEG